MTEQAHQSETGNEPDPTNTDDTVQEPALRRRGGSATGSHHVASALSRRFWAVLGAGVLLLAIALTAFVLRLPTTYAATSVVALRSGGGTDIPADEQKLLAGEYAVYLSSPANVDSVTGPYMSPTSDGNVDVTVDPDTTTMRIVVTTKSKKASVAVANGIASLAVTRGQDDKRAQVLSLAKATDSTTVVGPKRTLYLGAGCVLIAVLAGSCVYLKRRPA